MARIKSLVTDAVSLLMFLQSRVSNDLQQNSLFRVVKGPSLNRILSIKNVVWISFF